MQNYKRLRVTASAREVIRQTYTLTRHFPKEELFGLTSQMRRAAISIGLNIAEESGRRGWRDKLRLFETSRSSAMELELAIVVSGDLAYGDTDRLEQLSKTTDRTLRELTALISAIEKGRRNDRS
jgi:four helix bundle protein